MSRGVYISFVLGIILLSSWQVLAKSAPSEIHTGEYSISCCPVHTLLLRLAAEIPPVQSEEDEDDEDDSGHAIGHHYDFNTPLATNCIFHHFGIEQTCYQTDSPPPWS